MSKQSHWSDFDFSKVTWKNVFDAAGIHDKDPAALNIMTCDLEFLILKNLLEGKKWAKDTVRSICRNETIEQKIFDALDTLRGQACSKRSKIEQGLPSPSDFAKTIKPFDYLNDSRHSSSLHVGLQFKAFGKFLDIAKSGGEPSDMSKYYQLAHSLMLKMSGTFDSESERVSAFEAVIRQQRMWKLESVHRMHAKSDCSLVHEVSSIKHVLVNFEMKNELYSSSTCPNRQNIAYFLHFKEKQVGRSPMLLVSLVGPHYFQVFGAVWNGAQICVDPLSDPVSLLAVPRDPRVAVEKLARIIAAIDFTVEELKEYYECQGNEALWGVKGPYPLGGVHNFKQFGDREWLFEADLDGSPVCVKFVRSRYGSDVQKFLASKHLAPKLYSCHPLPGGWLAVVMDKVDGIPATRKDLTPAQKQSLRCALQLLDEKDYVHGDLRPQNILVRSGRVCILDFDWAGVCGIVRYPPELIIVEGRWHEGVKCGGEIRKEHDKFQADKL